MEITQYSITYRPRILANLYGQDRIRLDLGKRTETENWPKAMLLRGPFGTGKTSVAHIIASTIQCKNPVKGYPCGECPSCISIREERFDRDTVMLDGGILGQKDKVIEFTSTINIAPMYDTKRVFIIEEADQLSTGAINALLKILEGKNTTAHFILLSMVQGGIPNAIVSRCQKFDFKPVGIKDTMILLKSILERDKKWESVPEQFQTEGLSTIASLAKGSLREAVQTLETCIEGEHYSPDAIRDLSNSVDEVETYKILEGLLALSKDAGMWGSIYKTDPEQLYMYLTSVITDVMTYKVTGYIKDERFGWSTKATAKSPRVQNLFSALTDNPTFSKGYIRKSDIVAALLQYYIKEGSTQKPILTRKIPERST